MFTSSRRVTSGGPLWAHYIAYPIAFVCIGGAFYLTFKCLGRFVKPIDGEESVEDPNSDGIPRY